MSTTQLQNSVGTALLVMDMQEEIVSRSEEVQRVLLTKLFPRQAEVVSAETWAKMLNAKEM